MEESYGHNIMIIIIIIGYHIFNQGSGFQYDVLATDSSTCWWWDLGSGLVLTPRVILAYTISYLS